ncbi:hypothetical protein LCGC14_2029830, partial [marine sediment metagenome]
RPRFPLLSVQLSSTARSALRAREMTGLETVALSGGCFANRYVSARLERLLEGAGFRVLTHRLIPCNDGCVALGQAVVAARQLARSPEGELQADRNSTQPGTDPDV